MKNNLSLLVCLTLLFSTVNCFGDVHQPDEPPRDSLPTPTPLTGGPCELNIEFLQFSEETLGEDCPNAATIEFSMSCASPYTFWILSSEYYLFKGHTWEWTADSTENLIVVVQAPDSIGRDVLFAANAYFVDTSINVTTEVGIDVKLIENIPTLDCTDLVFNNEVIKSDVTSDPENNGATKFTITTSACTDGAEWTVTMENLDNGDVFGGEHNSIHNTAEFPNNTTIIIDDLVEGDYKALLNLSSCPFTVEQFIHVPGCETEEQLYYADLDLDGYGNTATEVETCNPAEGYVLLNGDCDDTQFEVHPGMEEIMCNEIDDNCNGLTDEGESELLEKFYVDADGDLYGNAAIFQHACTLPEGYVSNNLDCNDNAASINPSQTEISDNAIDDNCNGIIDEPVLLIRYYADYDADSYGNAAIFIDVAEGTNPSNFVLDNTDCDDTKADVHPTVANGKLLWSSDVMLFSTSQLPMDDYTNFKGVWDAENVFHYYTTKYLTLTESEVHNYEVVQLDTNGMVNWRQNFQTPNLNALDLGERDGAFVLDNASVTSDNGFVFSGNIGGTAVTHDLGFNICYPKAYIKKLNSTGSVDWTYKGTNLYNSKVDLLSPTNDGGVITQIVENNYPYLYAGPTPKDVNGAYKLVKFSPSGSIEWQIMVDTINSEQGGQRINTIKQTPDGGYITLTDVYENLFSITDHKINKLDATGNVVWSTNYPNPTFGAYPEYEVVVASASGNYYVAGSTEVGYYLLKYSASGSLIWNKSFIQSPNYAYLQKRNMVEQADGSLTVQFQRNELLYIDADGNEIGRSFIQNTIGIDAVKNGGLLLDKLIIGIPPGGANAEWLKEIVEKHSAKQAFDMCDGLDNDCDGSIDEDVELFTYYADNDNDGYGDATSTISDCRTSVPGYVSNNTDCNDNTLDINPGQEEICNGMDDNCNGLIDENIIDAFISPQGPVTVCAGLGVLISVPDQDGFSYTWKRNNTTVPGEFNSSIFATTTGNYKVNITAPGGCTKSSAVVKVNVEANPVASFTASTDLLLCGAADKVKFKANAGAGFSYRWTRNGVTAPGDAYTRNYTAKNPGNYSVTITNAAGCQNSAPPVAVINGCKETTESLNSALQIFPNPADQSVVIYLELENILQTTANMQIFAATGQLVFSQQQMVESGILQYEIPQVGALANGVYFVQITVGNQVFREQLNIIH